MNTTRQAKKLHRTLRATATWSAALLLAAGLGATATATAAPSAPATPAAAEQGGHSVEIVSTADGITAPGTTRPGLTTFHASTTQEGRGWVGLARLKDGADWDGFHDALTRALSNTPSDVPQGARDLAGLATLLGGLVIHPGQPGSFTQDLDEGTYLLFDYLTLGETEPHHRWLTVTGERADQGLTPTATVTATYVPGAGPRYEVSGTIRAGQPLRYVNALPGVQFNELLFATVREGTTEADLRAFFDAMPDDGSFPPDAPFTSLSLGSLHLSPGQSTVIQVPLQQARHAALTWTKDATDGIRLVKDGLFTLTDVA